MASRDLGRVLRSIVWVFRPLVMALTKRDWSGADYFPDGGFVVAANHVSHADPVTFGHFLVDNGVPPRFLAKASVLDVPVLGRIIAATGQIPVQRATATAAEAFEGAVRAIEEGSCVVVYPEGTLTRDPDLWPMSGKTGAVRIALATGCPVIPVAQWGPQDMLAPYSARLRLLPRTTVSVHAGPPVDLDDLRSRPVTAELLLEGTERLMDAITELLADIRGVPAPAQRLSLKDARAAEKPYARRRKTDG